MLDNLYLHKEEYIFYFHFLEMNHRKWKAGYIYISPNLHNGGEVAVGGEGGWRNAQMSHAQDLLPEV